MKKFLKKILGNRLNTLDVWWITAWPRWMGLRFLKSKRSQKFFNVLTFLSIAGIALGVTALIVVMSVMEGFETELRKRLINSEVHLLVTPSAEVPTFEGGFVDASVLETSGLTERLIKNPEVKKVWPIVSTEAILKAGNKVTGSLLTGLTQEHLKIVLEKQTEQADPSLLYDYDRGKKIRLPGIWIGQEMASMTGLIPGDRVTLISPTETQGPLESVPRMQRFVVEGIYASGLPDQELHSIFAHDETVRGFLRRSKIVSEWEIELHNANNAPLVSETLRQGVKGWRIRDWMDLNSNLFASLKLERIAMFVILTFVIVVASFNMVSTLTMVVSEKKRDIAVLKTLGATRQKISHVFLTQGGVIGAWGIGIGMALAAMICLLLDRYKFISLPDVYYDTQLPVAWRWGYFLGVGFSAAIIVGSACLYPCLKAGKLQPLEGLRR